MGTCSVEGILAMQEGALAVQGGGLIMWGDPAMHRGSCNAGLGLAAQGVFLQCGGCPAIQQGSSY